MTLTPPPSARLRFCMPAERHLDAMTAFQTGPRAAERGWSCRPHEAWRHWAAIIGHHALRGFGPFVGERLDDGQPVGLFGPWHPGGQAEREIKWTLWDGADEGRGLAREAAETMISFAFRQLGWDRAVSYIEPGNARSAALASRLGARKDGQWQTPSGKCVDVWRHPSPGDRL
ncbi:GNAT family N-acetyltransferase [Frigidibacter sp. SD6-1]|uniref:GNAT family N-acetyltransferase n=1 Tax=Frigidibacter sp. SD6-1 TaxID=3032581 RepID=UPI0024DF5BBC|nr:GNAT family N-acetyltransferase [Frigidibacter sp. SD6-1]